MGLRDAAGRRYKNKNVEKGEAEIYLIFSEKRLYFCRFASIGMRLRILTAGPAHKYGFPDPDKPEPKICHEDSKSRRKTKFVKALLYRLIQCRTSCLSDFVAEFCFDFEKNFILD